MEKLEKVKNFVLDILFPPKCLGCNREGSYICKDCEVFISENSLVCPVCGGMSFTGEKHKKCGTKYSLDGLISIWDYEGIIGKGLRLAKYEKITHIIDKFVERAFKIVLRDRERFSLFLKLLNNNKTAVVPISKEKQIKITANKIGGYTNTKVIDNKEINSFQNIILVSNIFRTGDKMRERAKKLKEEGIEKVWGFSLSRKV